MSKKPIKPWLSFQDQLDTLQERGLNVDNQPAALNYLKRLGYYRLSGYWYPLRAIDTAATQAQGRPVRSSSFAPDSQFEDVVKLYVFDKKLRLLALDALERIEMAVRVDIAYLLGQYDSLAHENAHCLHGNFSKRKITRGVNQGKTEHELWLSKYQSLLHRARREPFVQHHQQSYKSLPVWVAIEVLDFGSLSKLFSGMKHADKEQVARHYGIASGEEFAKWLRSLNFIRNVSAHHSRLWNINVLELSTASDGWPSNIRNAKPFFYFCIMQHLLKVICPNSSWGQRFKDLLKDSFPTPVNQQFTLNDFGVFAGWEEWGLWND